MRLITSWQTKIIIKRGKEREDCLILQESEEDLYYSLKLLKTLNKTILVGEEKLSLVRIKAFHGEEKIEKVKSNKYLAHFKIHDSLCHPTTRQVLLVKVVIIQLYW